MSITTQTASTITAVTAEHYASRVPTLVNRNAKLFSYLPKVRVFGAVHTWDVNTGGMAPEAASETAAISNAASDSYSKAYATMQQNVATFSVSNKAVDSAIGSDPAIFANLIVTNLDNAVNALFGHGTTGFNKQCFNGSGSSALFGLQTVIATSGTVYGLDVGSVTTFQGNVINAGGDALTLTDLDEGFEKIFVANGTTPNAIVCSGRDYRYLTILANKTKTTFQTNILSTAGGNIDLGSNTLTINGIPVIRDKDALDGYINLVNTDECYIAYLEPQVTGPNEWLITAQNGEQMVPMLVKQLGATGMFNSFAVSATCQLIVQRPNAFARITNFTIPS